MEKKPRRWLLLLRAAWIADRAGLLRIFALGVAFVSFLFLWPHLVKVGGAGPVLNNIVVHGYVLAWVMLVTIGVRSIGLRDVVPAFFLGMFLVPLIVFVPLGPVVDRLGSGSGALATWWVPPFEEAALLGGTALMAWRLSRRVLRRPGPLDLFVVGWAVGSGYAIHEDALYGRFLANFSGKTLVGAFEGAYGWLFPTFATNSPSVMDSAGPSTYHAGSGATYGLVLGLVILLIRRWPLVWLAVPAAWLALTFSHGLYNHQIWQGPSVLRLLTFNGHAEPIVLVLAVPVLLVFAYWRRRRVGDPGLPAFGWRGVREAFRRGGSPLDVVVRLFAYGQYHRGRNGLLNVAWSLPQEPLPPIRGIEAWGRIAFAPPSAYTRPSEASASSGGTASSDGAAPSDGAA